MNIISLIKTKYRDETFKTTQNFLIVDFGLSRIIMERSGVVIVAGNHKYSDNDLIELESIVFTWNYTQQEKSSSV